MRIRKTRDTFEEKDIEMIARVSDATISQHMKKLVESGLIEVKKKDKFSYYYANLGILMQYIDITKKYSIL